MGGEGGIAPSTGIFYPPVVVMAERLRAYIIEPEHRFYGASVPAPPYDTDKLSLLTAQQALADAAAFIQAHRRMLNCTGERGSGPRCPVITVGGSYPGFLSAMMRLRYPAVVDAAWAASAPMGFYSQAVAQTAYYERVTASAARADARCPPAVRAAVAATLSAPGVTKPQVIAGANLCTPLPAYLEAGSAALLVDEVAMVFEYSWANLNMANYPPTPSTGLARACAGFVDAAAGWPAVAAFLGGYGVGRREQGGCYNMSGQMPSGHDATISSGDWSGVGTGTDGSSWDYETCTYLVEAIGTNGVTDMFYPRAWSLGWLTEHCKVRFNVAPQPRTLPDLWGFDEDTLPRVTSRIIFTNVSCATPPCAPTYGPSKPPPPLSSIYRGSTMAGRLADSCGTSAAICSCSTCPMGRTTATCPTTGPRMQTRRTCGTRGRPLRRS
jgi:pimeloyl-ACP methyl ester carboxylesterase